MSALAAVVKLDLLTIRPYTLQIAILIGALGVLGIATRSPEAVLIVGAVYVSFIASYPFAVAEKNDLDTLYATLPVPRPVLIVGRYVVAVLAWLVVLAVGGVLAVVLESMGDTNAFLSAPDQIAASALVFGLFVGMQMPAYFVWGYSRARLLAYVPALVLTAIVVAIGSVYGEPLTRWASGQDVAWWIGPVVGASTLVASCRASIALDARRRG